MNADNLNAAFEADGPDFTKDATPTQVLAARIDVLEFEAQITAKRAAEMARAIDGLKCALKDASADLERAAELIPNPDDTLKFQLRSRIEQIRLLLASKKLK